MKNVTLLAVVLCLLVGPIARADWFCTDQSSERRGDSILACGEGDTAQIAFDEAWKEFRRICARSADCRYHDVIVTPQRTEIIHRTHNHGHKKKYRRLLAFEILETDEDRMEANRQEEKLVQSLPLVVDTGYNQYDPKTYEIPLFHFSPPPPPGAIPVSEFVEDPAPPSN